MKRRVKIFNSSTVKVFFLCLGDSIALKAYLEEEVVPLKLSKAFFSPVSSHNNQQSSSTNESSTNQCYHTQRSVPTNSKNTHEVLDNVKEYHATNSFGLITLMLESFGLTRPHIDQILTEDVKSSKPFENCMKSLQENYTFYEKLHEKYIKQACKFRTKSQLKDKLDIIAKVQAELVTSLREISDIKIQACIGLDQLSVNIKKKQQLLNFFVSQVGKLNKFLVDRELINGLKQRISQQKETLVKLSLKATLVWAALCGRRQRQPC